MSYQGATPTKFGRYSVAEAFRAERVHMYDGTTRLTTVTHQLPFAALDQEDLEAQGIDTSKVVPGAAKVDALGSCTANAGTMSLAAEWHRAGKNLGEIQLDDGHPLRVVLGPNTVSAEEFAITLYHLTTDQTGDPSTEWPPTDCGSTGLYVCTELERQKLITGYKSAPDVVSALSLLQTGTVIIGLPWFNSWMTPDAHGFVDGDGSVEAMWAAVASGVAGGHEVCVNAILDIALNSDGSPQVSKTILAVRNSWSESWGLKGNFRIHASTLSMLGSAVDYKQFVV